MLDEDQREWIDGLRAIADWYEAHPEYSSGDKFDAAVWFWDWTYDDPKEELLLFRRALGGTVQKGAGSTYFEVAKSFGPHKISGNTTRETVCEKVVKIVEEEVTEPDPEMVKAVPVITHTVEREVVEWVCPPSLLAG